MDRNLRKYQSNLLTSAKGVLLFGVWDAVKLAMQLLLDMDELRNLLGEQKDDLGMVIFVFTGLWLIFILNMLYRFYIWRKASAEALHGRKKNLYLLMTLLLAAVTVFSIVLTIREDPSERELDDRLTTILVDITSLLALLELLYSVFQVRRLRRQNNRAKTA